MSEDPDKFPQDDIPLIRFHVCVLEDPPDGPVGLDRFTESDQVIGVMNDGRRVQIDRPPECRCGLLVPPQGEESRCQVPVSGRGAGQQVDRFLQDPDRLRRLARVDERPAERDEQDGGLRLLRHRRAVLLERGAISPEQLDYALKLQAESGRRLGEILISEQIISENDLIEAISVKLRIPRMDLNDLVIDPAVLRLVPAEMARRMQVLPVTKIANQLGLSENTVRIHISAILRTLDLDNRTQAALLAAEYLRGANNSL